jgi:hypothetical protein
MASQQVPGVILLVERVIECVYLQLVDADQGDLVG